MPTPEENTRKSYSTDIGQVFEDPFWSVLEKQGRYRKVRIEFFLGNFIAGKVAGEVTLSKLFSEYKAFVKGQANKPHGGYRSVEDLSFRTSWFLEGSIDDCWHVMHAILWDDLRSSFIPGT